jgi:hypothetical protein
MPKNIKGREGGGIIADNRRKGLFCKVEKNN